MSYSFLGGNGPFRISVSKDAMTNTPSPTDEDRELIGKLRKPDAWQAYFHGNGSFSAIEEAAPFKAADRLESLRSDRAKLEERVRENLHGLLQIAAGVVEMGDPAYERSATLLEELEGRAALNRSTDRG